MMPRVTLNKKAITKIAKIKLMKILAKYIVKIRLSIRNILRFKGRRLKISKNNLNIYASLYFAALENNLKKLSLVILANSVKDTS